MGVPSLLIRPVDSSVMVVASRNLVVTSASLVAITASAVRARFSRSSSTSETNMAYCGCGSHAPVNSVGSGPAAIHAPCSGMTQTVRPSTVFVDAVTPGTCS